MTYSLISTVTCALFGLLILELRTKAPGAKTFPQVIRSRFGIVAHVFTTIGALITAAMQVTQVTGGISYSI